MRYSHLLILGIFFAGVTAAPRSAAGQRRAPGDTDPAGRVLARVVAGMTEAGTLSHPVSGLRILVVGESGDSATIRTDDAGVANAWVRPGDYRFMSLDPVTWEGRAYTWDMRVRIEPGTEAIRFSQATATSTEAAPPPPVPARAQPPTPGPRTRETPRLRVFADCEVRGCDFDYFRGEIPFVDYVRDRQEAALHILVTSQPTGGGGSLYTLNFIGQGELRGTADTLRYIGVPGATDHERRSGLARTIKLGLVRFVARTPVADQLQISYQAPQVGAVSIGSATNDPWNLWVFNIYVNGSFSGEESQHFMSLRSSTSASRVSESWKSRLSVYGNYDEGRYTFSDGSKFSSFTRSWGATQLLVRSFGPHWSVGERANLSSSSYLNQKLFLRFAPTVEYDVFPYAEASRRLLTFQYSVGVNYFTYEDTTIFNKLSEVRPHNSIKASLALRQPWGSASTSVEGAAYLDDFDKRSATLFNNLDVRLFKGFSVNLYAGVTLIRGQLYLAKGTLSDEDILVRRRQLASTYSYYGGVGFNYSFGSIFNNVVNPRFEGVSGSTLAF